MKKSPWAETRPVYYTFSKNEQRKTLFHSLPEGLDKQLNEKSRGKTGLSGEELKAETERATQLFPDVGSYDQKSITSYTGPALPLACESASEALKRVVSACESATPKPELVLSTKLIKVIVVCFNYFTKQLARLVVGDTAIPLGKAHKELKGLRVLNKFLMMTMGNKHNPVVLGQHDIVLTQVAIKALDSAHEQLCSHAKFKDTLLSTHLFCHQFQTLALIVSLNEGRSFMKTAASDSIKVILEALERFVRLSLTNSVLREVYRIRLGKIENWASAKQGHIKIAYAFGKKKFSLIQLGGDPQFSLRYMNLYFIREIAQLVSFDEHPLIKERVLKLAVAVLKDISEFLKLKLTENEPLTKEELSDIEIALNEGLVCFRIIRHILPNVGDPFALLERLGLIHFVKQLIVSYIKVLLKFELIPFTDINQLKEDEIAAQISYKTSGDYMGRLFSFINKLKDTKGAAEFTSSFRSFARSSKDSLLTLIEEIGCSIIEQIDSMQGNSQHLQVLQIYLTEFMLKNKYMASRNAMEYTINLIESNSFHYAAPKSLDSFFDIPDFDETGFEKLISARLSLILADSILYDKAGGEAILKHFLARIESLLADKEATLGLCRLIYGGVLCKCYSNKKFCSKVFGYKQTDVDYQRYAKAKVKEKLKSVRVFIEINGIKEIVNVLLNKLYEDNISEKTVKTVEFLFLKLVSVPAIGEQLLEQLPSSIELISYTRRKISAQQLTINFLENLVANVKYNSTPLANITKDNYLPYFLMNALDGDSGMKFAPAFLGLLVKLLTEELEAPSVTRHQLAMMKVIDFEGAFVRISEMNGEVMELFFKLLVKLQRSNDEVAGSIEKLQFINKNGVCVQLRKMIAKVLLLTIV